MPYVVHLGNPAPRYVPGHAPSVTVVTIPHESIVQAVADVQNCWADQGTTPPSWVACDDETLEFELARVFSCSQGIPG